MNSFHITLRTPPEILGMISSYLSEEDLFSASQVCSYWRSVLISIPYLWVRISCDDVPRTTVSLERSKSLPIQLLVDSSPSNVALENVLLHKNAVASLTFNYEPTATSQLPQLLRFSGPTVEQLHLYTDHIYLSGDQEETLRASWQGDFPSLRELFASDFYIPVDQLAAPNLVHLSLEHTEFRRDATVPKFLDMLHGCPLLETLLIGSSSAITPGPTRDRTSVRLLHLRCIEMGSFEVRSGLITYLDLPLGVSVGFRQMDLSDILRVDVPLTVLASIQHVLGGIGIRCVTLAAPPDSNSPRHLLIRFEGLRDSLEITTSSMYNHPQGQDILFGPEGVLFSYSPRIENVTELHVVGCSFESGQELIHVNRAMPKLVTISFFHCNNPPLQFAPQNPSSPPFPRLERVMVLGVESGLEEMARARKDLGIPLKTLIVGRGPKGSGYENLELDHTVLAELVEDLRIGCPTMVLDWETGNEVQNLWSTVRSYGPVSLTDIPVILVLTTFCSSFSKYCPHRLSFSDLMLRGRTARVRGLTLNGHHKVY